MYYLVIETFHEYYSDDVTDLEDFPNPMDLLVPSSSIICSQLSRKRSTREALLIDGLHPGTVSGKRSRQQRVFY